MHSEMENEIPEFYAGEKETALQSIPGKNAGAFLNVRTSNAYANSSDMAEHKICRETATC